LQTGDPLNADTDDNCTADPALNDITHSDQRYSVRLDRKQSTAANKQKNEAICSRLVNAY